MNIAIYWISNDYGGVDLCLKNLVNHWPNKNCNFYLFTNKKKTKDIKDLKMNLNLKKYLMWKWILKVREIIF